MGVYKINDKPNNDFSGDVYFHLEELEKDFNRLKFENNTNFYFVRFINDCLKRNEIIKELINRYPKEYFIKLYSEMGKMYRKMHGEVDGFNIKLSLKDNPDPSRMVTIEMNINKNILTHE